MAERLKDLIGTENFLAGNLPMPGLPWCRD